MCRTDDEEKICHMCPTTEAENREPLVWVDWMQADVCRECARFFGVGEEPDEDQPAYRSSF